MRIPLKIPTTVKGITASIALRQLMRTLDIQAAFYDRRDDPSHPDFQVPAIFVFWHEYMAAPFYLRGNCNIAMLISQHRDADALSVAARYSGFETVRGSTRRGGATAIFKLRRKSRQMNLAITPDGPRGPRRILAPGAIYLASNLQIPLIAIGLGYDRSWRLPTWDRFAIPKPFSRCRSVVSPRIYIPENLDRQGVERHRQRVEKILTRLTREAESWAVSLNRKTIQCPVQPKGYRKRWPPLAKFIRVKPRNSHRKAA